jgi:hypothetical protein
VQLFSGDGSIEIDNDISSGRDLGHNSFNLVPSGEVLDVQFDMVLAHDQLVTGLSRSFKLCKALIQCTLFRGESTFHWRASSRPLLGNTGQ